MEWIHPNDRLYVVLYSLARFLGNLFAISICSLFSFFSTFSSAMSAMSHISVTSVLSFTANFAAAAVLQILKIPLVHFYWWWWWRCCFCFCCFYFLQQQLRITGLIPTAGNGGTERVLIVEADSSVGEQALALGVSSQIDLDISEVGQAFVALGAMVQRAVAIEEEEGGNINAGGVTTNSSSSFPSSPSSSAFPSTARSPSSPPSPFSSLSSPSPSSLSSAATDDGTATAGGADPAPAVRIVRVLLADSSMPIQTGGGASTSLRQYVTAYNEIDVFIDSKAPLLRALESWADSACGNQGHDGAGAAAATSLVASGNAGSSPTGIAPNTRSNPWFKQLGWSVDDLSNPQQVARTAAAAAAAAAAANPSTHASAANGLKGSRGTIVFDTRNKTYFETMKRLLESRGWLVVDCPVLDREAEINLVPDAVWIVYEDSTTNTAHKVRQLVLNGHVEPSRCCALLDKQEGIDQLRKLSEESRLPPLPFVCSSEVYDGLFSLVRKKIREGTPNTVIQATLDATVNS